MAKYSGNQAVAIQRRWLDEVSHFPGVTAVAYANYDSAGPPIIRTPMSIAPDAAELRGVKNRKFRLHYFKVSPGYMPASGTRFSPAGILPGMTMQGPVSGDRQPDLAHRLFGTDKSAIGKYFEDHRKYNFEDRRRRSRDGKYDSVVSEDPTAAIYLSHFPNG